MVCQRRREVGAGIVRIPVEVGEAACHCLLYLGPRRFRVLVRRELRDVVAAELGSHVCNRTSRAIGVDAVEVGSEARRHAPQATGELRDPWMNPLSFPDTCRWETRRINGVPPYDAHDDFPTQAGRACGRPGTARLLGRNRSGPFRRHRRGRRSGPRRQRGGRRRARRRPCRSR